MEEKQIKLRTQEEAEALMCPYSFNNPQPAVSFYCKHIECMGWEDEAEEGSEDVLGYCKPIERGLL